MVKGRDYTGISVTFFCHDGDGNFVLHKRGARCRDENFTWDFGGGSLEHGETLEDGVMREVAEEYGTKPLTMQFLGFDEVFREHNGAQTHWIAFRYKVLVSRDAVINAEPETHDEIGWFALDALPAPLHSQLPHCLEKYKTQLRE